jgi:hypothetical protein
MNLCFAENRNIYRYVYMHRLYIHTATGIHFFILLHQLRSHERNSTPVTMSTTGTRSWFLILFSNKRSQDFLKNN